MSGEEALSRFGVARVRIRRLALLGLAGPRFQFWQLALHAHEFLGGGAEVGLALAGQLILLLALGLEPAALLADRLALGRDDAAHFLKLALARLQTLFEGTKLVLPTVHFGDATGHLLGVFRPRPVDFRLTGG